MTFQRKSALMMFLLGSTLLLLFSVAYYFVNRRSTIEQARLFSTGIAEKVAHSMDLFLLEKERTAKTMASSPLLSETLKQSNANFAGLPEAERLKRIEALNGKWLAATSIDDPLVQGALQNPVADFLRTQQAIFPGEYGEIFLTNRYGALVASTGKLTTFAHAHKYWWKASFRDGKGITFFDDRGYDASVEGYVLGVVVPVRDGDEIIGILKINLSVMDALADVVQSMGHHEETRTLRLVRTGGRVVLQKGVVPLSTRVPDAVVDAIQGGMCCTLTQGAEAEGLEVIAFAPVDLTRESDECDFGGSPKSIDHIAGNEGEGWYIVSSQSLAVLLANTKRTTQAMLAIGIAFGLVMAVGAWRLSRNLARPILQLVEHSEKIGQGDFDVKVDISSKDELGTLGESFNSMAYNLRRTMISRNLLLEEAKRRKRAEEERIQLEIHLRQQQKLEAIGTLAGGVAHEINNPIFAIMNFAQLIDDELDPESPLREYCMDIGHETDRIAKIVRNLLAFARQENESSSPTRIDEVVDHTISLIRAVIRGDQISLEVDVAEDLPTVKCHSQQIQQVLMNLLTNARDALNERYPEHDPNKTMTLTVRSFEKEGQAWLRTTVEDHGTGISDEVRKRMFEPFFTTKDRTKGTGMGLAISHGIVREHHGELRMETKLGEYTRFHIELPVNEGPLGKAPQALKGSN